MSRIRSRTGCRRWACNPPPSPETYRLVRDSGRRVSRRVAASRGGDRSAPAAEEIVDEPLLERHAEGDHARLAALPEHTLLVASAGDLKSGRPTGILCASEPGRSSSSCLRVMGAACPPTQTRSASPREKRKAPEAACKRGSGTRKNSAASARCYRRAFRENGSWYRTPTCRGRGLPPACRWGWVPQV